LLDGSSRLGNARTRLNSAIGVTNNLPHAALANQHTTVSNLDRSDDEFSKEECDAAASKLNLFGLQRSHQFRR